MEPHVEGILKHIALREGLSSAFRATASANPIGKSFHGVVKSIVLEDGSKRLPLIVKQAHTDALTRDAQKTREKFRNEVHFYSEVIGRMSRFGPIPRVPKFHGSVLTELEETIVLEDLSAEGFVLVPLSRGLDAAHLSAVAKALATLHESSSTWKTRDPISFRQVVNSLEETFFVTHENPRSQKLASLLFVHALKSGLGCVPSDLGRQCSDYLTNFMIEKLDEIDDWVKPLDEERFTTILHGDAWCHNFLFKYNSFGDPVEVALVDWQMVRLGSPALDLVECFLSSAQNSALARPTDFLSSYAEARRIQSELLTSDFPRWGRPGLLLALSILVHVTAQGEGTLADRFEKAVGSNDINDALDLKTRLRIQSVLRAAQSMGLFKT